MLKENSNCLLLQPPNLFNGESRNSTIGSLAALRATWLYLQPAIKA